MTAGEDDEASEVTPVTLLARTVKVTDASAVKPLTVMGEDAPVAVAPPLLVTV